MRKVIDSNQLRAPALKDYLAASRSNFAVLTDYAAMEAYAGESLTTLYHSLAIVSQFPKQVVVLKNTVLACGLNGRSAGLQKRLIDERQTREFPQFVRALQQARSGSESLREQLQTASQDARDHLQRMLKDAETTGAAFAGIEKLYDKAERRQLRQGPPYPIEIARKIAQGVSQVARELFDRHPSATALPPPHEVANTFIFRSALAGYLLSLDWAVNGGAMKTAPAKLRNDMVDANFVAFGTYFDGLLSEDAKTMKLYAQAKLLLQDMQPQ